MKHVGGIFAKTEYFVYIAITFVLPRLIWIHENTWYNLWSFSSFGIEYRGMAANANLCEPYLNTKLLYSQSLLSLVGLSMKFALRDLKDIT